MNKTFAALPLLAGMLCMTQAWADTPSLTVNASELSGNLTQGNWALMGDGRMDTQMIGRNYQEGSSSLQTQSWFSGVRWTDTLGNTWEKWWVNEYKVTNYTQDIYTRTGTFFSLQQQQTLTPPSPNPLGLSTDSQWLHMDLSSSGLLNYQISANATTGSRTSPRGNPQTILPALGLSVDGLDQSSSLQTWGGTWASIYRQGSFANQLTLDLEATDGGEVKGFWLTIYANDEAFSHAEQGKNWQYLRQWSEDRLVSAVPEPSSYALMLAGLVGVLSLQRRRPH